MSSTKAEEVKFEESLDSLAYLLERDGADCAAIYLFSNKLIIANNSIYEDERNFEGGANTARKSNDALEAQQAQSLSCFSDFLNALDLKEQHAAKTRFLKDIFLAKLSKEIRGNLAVSISNEDRRILAEIYFNPDYYSPENEEKNNLDSGPSYEEAKRLFVEKAGHNHSKKPRAYIHELAQDIRCAFSKVSHFVSDNPEHPLAEALTTKEVFPPICLDIYGAISSETVESLRNPSTPAGYAHLKTNGPLVHAEIKIIDFLIVSRLLTIEQAQKNTDLSFYLGISKKSCPHCDAAIKSVNEVVRFFRESEEGKNFFEAYQNMLSQKHQCFNLGFNEISFEEISESLEQSQSNLLNALERFCCSLTDEENFQGILKVAGNHLVDRSQNWREAIFLMGQGCRHYHQEPAIGKNGVILSRYYGSVGYRRLSEKENAPIFKESDLRRRGTCFYRDFLLIYLISSRYFDMKNQIECHPNEAMSLTITNLSFSLRSSRVGGASFESSISYYDGSDVEEIFSSPEQGCAASSWLIEKQEPVMDLEGFVFREELTVLDLLAEIYLNLGLKLRMIPENKKEEAINNLIKMTSCFTSEDIANLKPRYTEMDLTIRDFLCDLGLKAWKACPSEKLVEFRDAFASFEKLVEEFIKENASVSSRKRSLCSTPSKTLISPVKKKRKLRGDGAGNARKVLDFFSSSTEEPSEEKELFDPTDNFEQINWIDHDLS